MIFRIEALELDEPLPSIFRQIVLVDIVLVVGLLASPIKSGFGVTSRVKEAKRILLGAKDV